MYYIVKEFFDVGTNFVITSDKELQDVQNNSKVRCDVVSMDKWLDDSDVTAFICDVWNMAQMAVSNHDPEGLSIVMRGYCKVVVDFAKRHSAELDKFMKDFKQDDYVWEE